MASAAKMSSGASDRALAALFAPADIRPALSDLYLWAEEIESIPFKAKEPAIQAMRFAWHRDAVADVFGEDRKVRRHAAYEGLVRVVDQDVGVTPDALQTVIDAIEDGTMSERIPDDDALLSIIDRHHGTLMRIAVEICGGTASSVQIEAAARTVGLAQWCREFSLRAGSMMALIPEAALSAKHFNVHRLATGREPEMAGAAFEGVVSLLEIELDHLQRGAKCPPELFPAIAPSRLARATLKKVRSASDLYRTDFHRPQIARQFDLIKASLTGRL